MEGMPTVENAEHTQSWEVLKLHAGDEARKLMGDIEGYESMTLDEKIVSIGKLMVSLEGDNENRFVYQELSLEHERMLEDKRHADEMRKLGPAL